MTVEVQVTYDGNLCCTAIHGPSGSRIRTTAPTDNGGDGSLFSPTDLIGTSMATCIVTIMALAAKARGIDLTGTTARVEKHMASEGPRRIARLPVTVRVPLDLPDDQRAALENAARGCPVHRTLGTNVDAPISFEWGAASDTSA